MWNHDYCTVCDKICASGSIFCSDQCRLIEAESDKSASSSDYSLLVASNSSTTTKSATPSIMTPRVTPPSPKESLDYFAPKKEFMYTSPLLQPQSMSSSSIGGNAANAPLSPPPSPLLMPISKHSYYVNSGSVESTKPHCSSYSTMSSYRKWLTA